jgi:hypothetical protein
MMTALALTAMLAITALSIDAAFMYDTRNRMGAAADAASLAAAQELKRSANANLQRYANREVAMHGFNPGDGATIVTVNNPPANGPFNCANSPADCHKYVEVLVSRPMSTFFARMFGSTTMNVGSRAVAGPGGDVHGCIYALSTTGNSAFPIALNVASATIQVPDCSVVSNDDFSVPSGSTVNAKSISVGGTCLDGPSPCTDTGGTVTCAAGGNCPQVGVGATPDPLADMDQATLFGTSWPCDFTNYSFDVGTVPQPHGANSTTVFCGDGSTVALDIGGSGPCDLGNPPPGGVGVKFLPGVYIFNGGGIKWMHTCVIGTGVTFYFTATTGTHDYPSCGGKVITTDGPDDFHLSAPTSGPYEGLLFIQDRTKAGPGVTNCNTTGSPVKAQLVPNVFQIDGVIYFPTNNITYGATGVGSGTYTILIGDTIKLTGTATLGSDFSGLANGSPIHHTASAE